MVKWALLCAAVTFGPSLASAATWQVDTVDREGAGDYNALRIDRDGNVHVIYVADSGDQHSLRYAFWDHALKRWFTMNVGNGASFCSMAIDSKNRPHISWADHGTSEGAKLRYGHWDGSSWQITAIPLNSEVVGYYTSIVLDSFDRPRISFYEYRGPRGTDIAVRMRVVSWTGKYWEAQTVDGENQSGKFNALSIDSQSLLHLAYANVGAQSSGVRYAKWTGEKWVKEVVEDQNTSNGDTLGYSISITVDEKDRPHLVYANRSRPAVRYAFKDGSLWHVETVDTLAAIAYPDRFSVAIGPGREPCISYDDLAAGTLKLACRSGSRWWIEIVDEGGVGFTSSLAVNQQNIWIAYADTLNGALKVAHREWLSPQNGSDNTRLESPAATDPKSPVRAKPE